MATTQVRINSSWKSPHSKTNNNVQLIPSKRALSVAKDELNEDEKTKELALAEFRSWVLKNTGLVNCRSDDTFLLRFLRARKWSVAKAEHNLVKYLNFRQSISRYIFQLDCDEVKVSELIHAGYLFPSPIRDSKGCRVIIGVASKLDTSRFNAFHFSKVHGITYEALLEDEENQIMGFQHFGDFQGMHLGHLGFFNPIEFAMIMRIGEQAYPMRHKGIHFININPAFKYAYDFFSTRFSEKIRSRLMLHNSLKDLHRQIDRKCLPKEYGGDIPMADMIIAWQKELSGLKQTILNLDNMKSLIPIRYRQQQNKLDEMRGTFKKLEVD